MRTATVTLGGKQYIIQALPIGRSAAWRRKLAGPFGELSRILSEAGEIEITNGADLAQIVRVLEQQVIGSVDVLLGLLFDYSPALASDRERIEVEAFDDEALAALVEVLKLAYPFGELRDLVSGATTRRTT